MINKVQRLKILNLVIVVAVLTAVILPLYAQAALVPCGLSENDPNTPGDETRMCQFCDFFVLIDRVKNFAMVDIVTPLGVLFIVAGGVMILLGGQWPSLYPKGKTIVWNTVIAVFLIFSTWMITNTVIQLVAGDSNISQSWYKLSCTESGPVVGETPAPTGPGRTPVVTPGRTPTPVPGPTTGLMCPNARSLIITYNPRRYTPNKCDQFGGTNCPDCVKLIDNHSSDGRPNYAAASLGNLLNSSILPKIKAAGISYTIRDGMCPRSEHGSCAHFNGHAVDIGGVTEPAKLRKVCQILNDAGLQGKSSCGAVGSATRKIYIMEKSVNAGAPCPPPSSGCGSASFHIQN